MSLKDHYLVEDHEMMADHLEKLLKTSLQIQSCALEGNFNHDEQLLQNIHQSLKVLSALNQKKVEKDRVNEEASLRRNWF